MLLPELPILSKKMKPLVTLIRSDANASKQRNYKAIMQQKESRIPMSQKPKQDDSEWKTNINHVDKKKAAPGIQ